MIFSVQINSDIGIIHPASCGSEVNQVGYFSSLMNPEKTMGSFLVQPVVGLGLS